MGDSSLTMTFTAPSGPGHYQLRIIQDGTGGRTKGTWPTIKTPGGSSSNWVLSTGIGAVDILNIYYDGSSYWGMLSLDWK